MNTPSNAFKKACAAIRAVEDTEELLTLGNLAKSLVTERAERTTSSED